MFNKKMKQRICAVLLTAVMAFTTAGIPVMAEEIASDTAADEEFKDEAPQIPGLTYEVRNGTEICAVFSCVLLQ